jgi:acyl-CoA synthetase (AMP-forming)/AMP-acid ligase II
LVIEKIFDYAQSKPGKLAISYGGRSISYGVLAFWISQARQFLSRQDLRVGSVAVLNVDSRLDDWVFGLALRSLGITTIAVPSLDALDKLGVRDIGCVINTIRDQPPRIPPTGTSYRHIQIHNHMYLDEPADGIPDLPKELPPPGGHILLTSGTTGTSKKVLIDAAHLAIITKRRAEIFGISERSIVNVHHFATWVGAGYKLPSCAWSMGGSVVVHQGLDVHRSFLIDGITHTFVTPAILSDILKAPPDEIRRNEAMRLFVGGGPLPCALAEAARTRLTPHIFTSVSSTEGGTWGLTPIERPEDLRSHCVHPSIEVQVVDQEHRPLPVGQIGAVRIRVVDGFTGYMDDEEATRAFFREGYFYSGDLGAFQADGRLALHGRASNVINILGYKVAAEPIEQALQERLGADGVCVFSMQHEGTDEELHIVIQSHRPIHEAELAASVNATLVGLAGFPHARVHFIKALPRGVMGKVERAVLRQQIAARRTGAST